MRLVVRGCTGSGKSTLGMQLGRQLNLPFIDLDDLYHLPDWQERPREEMLALLAREVEKDEWVVVGNYSYCDDLILPRITDLVWLDYNRVFTFARLLRRTIRRIVKTEPCCNGNQELLGKSFSRDGILWWHIISYRKIHERADRFFADSAYAHVRRVRFRRPRETDEWRDGLASG